MTVEKRTAAIEHAIEALAHGRYDLVDPALRRQIEEDDDLRREVEATRELSGDLGGSLARTAIPAMDLDALIAHAMTKAPEPSPSRRALLLSGVFGAILAASLAVVAIPAPTTIADTLRRGIAVTGALDSLVTVGLPGGWASVAFVGLVFVFGALFAMRWMTRVGSAKHVVGAAAILLVPLAFAAPSRALEFEGEWPASETTIDLAVEHATVGDVIARAADAAGLGLVHSLPADLLATQVTLRVEDASLHDVLDAVLGDAPVTARRTATMLVLRPTEAPTPEVPSEPVAPLVPDAAPMLEPPMPEPPMLEPPMLGPPMLEPPMRASDRVTFGGDVHVRPGERVNSVASAGGDVVIEGEVLRDVASAGGDVEIRSTGVVNGAIVSMGGDVEIAEGAVVQGEISSFGGEVSYRGGSGSGSATDASGASAVHSREAESASYELASSFSEWIDYVSKSAAWHAILFLAGLFLMSVSSERWGALRRAFRQAPFKAAFAGVLASVIIAVLSLVLVIVIIGIPAAIALGIAATLAVMAGTVSFASVIGDVLPIEAIRGKPIAALATGLLVLFFASIIPGVGPLLGMLAAAIGLGAVVLTRFGKRAPND